MPYIEPGHYRDNLDPTKRGLAEAANAGELNFQITRLVSRYVTAKGGNYGAINEAIGALECAKLEAYRRIAAPYESTKLAQNGDVYT